jgi:hypothetical protein
VVAALVVAGLALWLAAPRTAAAALPLFVLLACPLGMLLMVGAMGSGRGRRDDSELDEVRAEVAALRREREASQERRA